MRGFYQGVFMLGVGTFVGSTCIYGVSWSVRLKQKANIYVPVILRDTQ
jgi:hypothetical protein